MVLYIVVAVKKHDPKPAAGVGSAGIAIERNYRSYNIACKTKSLE